MFGTIFNIQKFCINDGPGIRTTVFFKGCPLRCKWCHNPESQKKSPELLFSADKCVTCRKCETVCENKVHIFTDSHILLRESCIACKKCEALCPNDAIEIAGRRLTADEVLKEVLSDKEFFEDSGGGLTLSGGEPFMQFDFMLSVLKEAKKEGIHTCVETCGFAAREKLLEAAPFIDIFLFDYKITDSSLHKEFTGTDNTLILSNLRALSSAGCKIILRCPVIPGVNDNDGHFRAIGDLSRENQGIIAVDIAPYHELGISKGERLGEQPEVFSVPSKNDEEYYIESVRKYTRVPVNRM